jgi:hypothetical protein
MAKRRSTKGQTTIYKTYNRERFGQGSLNWVKVMVFSTTGATSGAETVYSSGAPEFTPVFSGVRVSSKHTYKTKDEVTRTPLKTGVNSGAPEE